MPMKAFTTSRPELSSFRALRLSFGASSSKWKRQAKGRRRSERAHTKALRIDVVQQNEDPYAYEQFRSLDPGLDGEEYIFTEPSSQIRFEMLPTPTRRTPCIRGRKKAAPTLCLDEGQHARLQRQETNVQSALTAFSSASSWISATAPPAHYQPLSCIEEGEVIEFDQGPRSAPLPNRISTLSPNELDFEAGLMSAQSSSQAFFTRLAAATSATDAYMVGHDADQHAWRSSGMDSAQYCTSRWSLDDSERTSEAWTSVDQTLGTELGAHIAHRTETIPVVERRTFVQSSTAYVGMPYTTRSAHTSPVTMRSCSGLPALASPFGVSDAAMRAVPDHRRITQAGIMARNRRLDKMNSVY